MGCPVCSELGNKRVKRDTPMNVTSRTTSPIPRWKVGLVNLNWGSAILETFPVEVTQPDA